MSVTISWLGPAAFTIADGTDTVLIDPWLTGNPVATAGPDDVEPTLIAVTHGHLDHLGDATLFGDMAIIGDEDLDVAIIPIGGTHTMEPAAAAKAVKLLQPRIVIPNHFNTFPGLQQNPDDLVADLHAHAKVRVLGFGESTTV